MGEKKNGKDHDHDHEEKKNKGSEKKDDGGKTTTPVVVLKIEMHCDGCAKKVIKSIKRFEGVEDVNADSSTSKVTVYGKVEPLKLRDKVESKTKKKVELISPLPNNKNKDKDTSATDKKPQDKSEKKKEPQVTTAVTFKTRLHCEGCTHKIYKSISKIKGVESVTIDKLQELVTVKGTMDVKELPSHLKKKHNRSVEIIGPKKEDKKEGGDKKEKASGGDNEKKPVEEAIKMDYYGPPGYGYGHGYGYPQQQGGYVVNNVHPPPPQMYGYPQAQQGGYVVNNVHPPQMFSDENPNACSVM